MLECVMLNETVHLFLKEQHPLVQNVFIRSFRPSANILNRKKKETEKEEKRRKRMKKKSEKENARQ